MESGCARYEIYGTAAGKGPKTDMKHNNQKEILSILVSALLALVLFCILLFCLKWNLFLCMLLTAGVYLALSLLLRPVPRIGKVEIDSLENGEFLNERLTEASSDYIRMRRAAAQITEEPLHTECGGLLTLAGNILKYLTANPEKIPAARRYIDYYQETAANVLEHYTELKESGLSTSESERILSGTRETVSTLKQAFQMQFEKLMQDELMDMEADLKLLKQTLRSEGYREPEKKKGLEQE